MSAGGTGAHAVMSTAPGPLTFHLGREELTIRKRYEVVSIVNDILIALWFTAGSFLFFSESTTTLGTWFFVVGSIELLIRPVIRLTRRVHLGRIHPEAPGEAGHDF